MTFKPDTGWSWMVLVATSHTFLINGVNLYSIGVVHFALLEKYKGSVTQTATIVSVFSSLSAIAGCVAVVIINKLNCRACQMTGGIMLFSGLTASAFVDNLNWLMITYGVIAGTGTGLCYTSSLVSVGYYFHRLRALATGITVGGAGVGMFCGSVLTRALQDSYGVNGTFMILGGINANMCVTALLMRPSHYEKQQSNLPIKNSIFHDLKQNIRETCALFPKLYRNKSYVFFVITTSTWFLGVSSILVHEPAHAIYAGVATRNEAAVLATMFGLFNTISRYLVGLSTSKTGLDPMVVHIGQMAIMGTTCLTFPLYSDTYLGHTIFCTLAGFYTGGFFAQNSPITCDILGVEIFASGFGILMFIGGFAWLFGPPIIGTILDQGGTYSHGFILIGIVFYIGTFTNLLAGIFMKDNPTVEAEDFDYEVCVDKELIFKEEENVIQDHLTIPKLQALQAFSLSINSLNSLTAYHKRRRISLSTPQLNVCQQPRIAALQSLENVTELTELQNESSM